MSCLDRNQETSPIYSGVFCKIKYLGIYQTKVAKDLYTENCKTLLKNTKEDTDEWKDILCL